MIAVVPTMIPALCLIFESVQTSACEHDLYWPTCIPLSLGVAHVFGRRLSLPPSDGQAVCAASMAICDYMEYSRTSMNQLIYLAKNIHQVMPKRQSYRCMVQGSGHNRKGHGQGTNATLCYTSSVRESARSSAHPPVSPLVHTSTRPPARPLALLSAEASEA